MSLNISDTNGDAEKGTPVLGEVEEHGDVAGRHEQSINCRRTVLCPGDEQAQD